MSITHSNQRAFASVAAYWIVANIVPQALLVVAAWAYLRMNGLGLADLFARAAFQRLPYPVAFAGGTAAAYLVASVWMRGAVLGPLVPRFKILGWIVAALLSGVVMLALTTGGSLIGLAVAKGLEVSHTAPNIAIPSGWTLAPFILGMILGTEMMGLILGGLPGLAIAVGEALVVGRSTRSVGAWVLWGAATWATIVTIIVLHAFLVVFNPQVPRGILLALAPATPIVLGLAAALVTLPAVARLVSRSNSAA